MNPHLNRPATADGLFLWVMHRFAEEFKHGAILKGGMALRLIDSPRATTDIDYVFVPHSSKQDVRKQIEEVLHEIDDVELVVAMHSKMLRIEIHVDSAAIQLEVNVALECEGVPMSTGGFARGLGHPAQVIRVMSPGWAFAHKLAAWNERRLHRDLYDCYFYAARLGATPANSVLLERLAKVDSRLPALSKTKSMTRDQLAEELRSPQGMPSQRELESELAGLLPPTELAGLELRLRAAIAKLAEWLESGE